MLTVLSPMATPLGAATNPIYSQSSDTNQPLLSPAACAAMGSVLPTSRVDVVRTTGEQLFDEAMQHSGAYASTQTPMPPPQPAVGHEHGSTGPRDLNDLCRAQAQQIEMLMQTMQAQLLNAQHMQQQHAQQHANMREELQWYRDNAEAAQAAHGEMIHTIQRTQDREEERHVRRTSGSPEHVSAVDIAKIASACPHDGNTEKGLQWWAGVRGIMQRTCARVVSIAESDQPPEVPAGPADKLLFDMVVACIDTNKTKGADLLLTIRQQTPSIIDHGWHAKRIMCEEGVVLTTAEADAIYSQIKAEAISIDTTKEQARTIAHKITAKWLRLPQDRRGHSRRNVELLIEAIPDNAMDVRRSVQALCDAREGMPGAEPFSIDEMAVHVYSHMHRWRVLNPSASASTRTPPFAGNTTLIGDTRKCANCGKQNAHHPKDCDHKCKTCGFSFCGTGHGKTCPLTERTLRPREQILTALGKPLMPWLYGKLQAAHKKKYADTANTANDGGGNKTNVVFFDDDAPLNFTIQYNHPEDEGYEFASDGTAFVCGDCDTGDVPTQVLQFDIHVDEPRRVRTSITFFDERSSGTATPSLQLSHEPQSQPSQEAATPASFYADLPVASAPASAIADEPNTYEPTTWSRDNAARTEPADARDNWIYYRQPFGPAPPRCFAEVDMPVRALHFTGDDDSAYMMRCFDTEDTAMITGDDTPRVRAIVDSGSNVVVSNTTAIAPQAAWKPPMHRLLGGVNGNAPAIVRLQAENVPIVLTSNGVRLTEVFPRVLIVDAAPPCIISHAVLEDTLGHEVRYKQGYTQAANGTRVDIEHKPRGLYSVWCEPVPEEDVAMVISSNIPHNNRLVMLWSARAIMGPEALKQLQQTTVGHRITSKFTHSMLQVVETDDCRKQANGKSKPHPTSAPTSRASRPGGRFIIDAWGPCTHLGSRFCTVCGQVRQHLASGSLS